MDKRVYELGQQFGMAHSDVDAFVLLAATTSPDDLLDLVKYAMKKRDDEWRDKSSAFYYAMLGAIALGEGRVTLKTKEMLEFVVAEALKSPGTITEQRFLERMATKPSEKQATA